MNLKLTNSPPPPPSLGICLFFGPGSGEFVSFKFIYYIKNIMIKYEFLQSILGDLRLAKLTEADQSHKF